MRPLRFAAFAVLVATAAIAMRPKLPQRYLRQPSGKQLPKELSNWQTKGSLWRSRRDGRVVVGSLELLQMGERVSKAGLGGSSGAVNLPPGHPCRKGGRALEKRGSAKGGGKGGAGDKGGSSGGKGGSSSGGGASGEKMGGYIDCKPAGIMTEMEPEIYEREPEHHEPFDHAYYNADGGIVDTFFTQQCRFFEDSGRGCPKPCLLTHPDGECFVRRAGYGSTGKRERRAPGAVPPNPTAGGAAGKAGAAKGGALAGAAKGGASGGMLGALKAGAGGLPAPGQPGRRTECVCTDPCSLYTDCETCVSHKQWVSSSGAGASSGSSSKGGGGGLAGALAGAASSVVGGGDDSLNYKWQVRYQNDPFNCGWCNGRCVSGSAEGPALDGDTCVGEWAWTNMHCNWREITVEDEEKVAESGPIEERKARSDRADVKLYRAKQGVGLA